MKHLHITQYIIIAILLGGYFYFAAPRKVTHTYVPSTVFSYTSTPVQMATRSGTSSPVMMTQRMKVFMCSFTPNQANGGSIDISNLGLTTVNFVQPSIRMNTTTATSVPGIAIKSYTTSAVNFNIVAGNSSLVTILGSGVLLGVATLFPADVSGMTVDLWIVGT